jgi:PAS domain S-box-containing protein
MAAKKHHLIPTVTRPPASIDERELRGLGPAFPGDELLLLTDTGRIVHASKPFLERMGYELADMYRMTLPQIEPDNTRASWLSFVSTLKRAQATRMREVVHVTRDGARLRKDVAFTPVTYQGKAYILCVGNVLETIAAEAEQETASVPVAVPVFSHDNDSRRDTVVMQTVSDAVIVVDARGLIMDANPQAERLHGLNRNEMIGRSCVDAKWRLVDLRGNLLRIAEHPVMIALVGEVPVMDTRIAMLQPDGSTRMLLVNATPVFDASRRLNGAIASFRPATSGGSIARKGSSGAANGEGQASALLTAHREVIWEAMRADSIDEIERKVCALLIRTGDYPLAWFGSLKENDQRVHPSTWAGEASEYLLKIKIRYDDSDFGNGPYGQALKTGTKQVVENTQDDPRYEVWKKQSERAHLLSMVSIPLVIDGAVKRVLSVYGKQKGHFGEGEVSLIEEIAEIAAYAITGLVQRGEYRKMRGEGAIDRMLVDALMERTDTAVAVFEARSPFRTLRGNRAYCGLLDDPFRKKGVADLYLTDYLHAHSHAGLYGALDDVAGSGEALLAQPGIFRTPMGEETAWTWSVKPVIGESGVDHLLFIAQPAGLPGEAPSAAVPSLPRPVAAIPADAVPALPASAPVAKTRVAKAPEAKAPEAKAPEAKAPEAKAPEAKAQAVKAPPVKEAIMEAPKKKRGAKKPAAEEPALTVLIDMPTPGPRMRMAKRLTLFYDLGRIVRCDAEAARLLGFDAADIARDLPAGDLLPDEDLFRAYLAESVGENRDGAPFFWDGSALGLVSCSVHLERQSPSVTRVTLSVTKL